MFAFIVGRPLNYSEYLRSQKILIADLNNFARYPTLSVGYLTAVCREVGHDVRVFSPLAIGVSGVQREEAATPFRLLSEKLNFAVAQSRFSAVRAARVWIGENLRSSLSRNARKVLASFIQELEANRPDVVMVSSYLMYQGLVEAIALGCKTAGVPVLLGGPYFAQPEVVSQWVAIPGVTALAAGEVELRLPEIIRLLLDGGDITRIEGMVVSDGEGGFRGSIAQPLKQLDELPTPDFTDFPWHRYPERIAPVLTGRGCAWGVCTFCSDVTGTAGRTFRSRDPRRVLDEIRRQHETLGVDLFVFTDMKLNSNLEMWNALISKIQDVAPKARWIASVHAGEHGDSGLSAHALRYAAEAGCVRLTTGLESGSQRMLDLMQKGTRLKGVSDYLHAAAEAGISTRATMIVGYLGETAKDVSASARFVEEHREAIERIKLSNFTLTIGTAIDRRLQKTMLPILDANGSDQRPDAGALDLRRRPEMAKIDYRTPHASTRDYRRAMTSLIEAVHSVNRQPLRKHAAAFEGVM